MPEFHVFRHFPVHLSIGPFITELARYIDEEVYPNRFKFKMIAPADKSIQRIEEEKSDIRELQKAPLPSLVLTPVIDEPVQQWYKLWNSRRMAPRLGSVMAKGILSTDDYFISYVTRRIAGHVDIAIVTKSYMEAHDIMMAFYDQLYNINSWVILPEINLYFVVPEELVFYTEDGGRIVVDWSNTKLSHELVKSINQKKYLFPLKHHPYIRLTSLSDASNLYGGTDSVPVYGLTGTIEYEMDMPAYLTIETDYLIKDVELTLEMGSYYFPNTVYEYLNSPAFIRGDYVYYPQNRYHLTFDSVTAPGYTIDLDYARVEHDTEYIFFTNKGELYEGVDYEFVNSGKTVVFKKFFDSGTVLEYVYCHVSHIH